MAKLSAYYFKKMVDFRLNLLIAAIIILSVLLVLRLAYLQLSEFKRYQTLSLKNQMSVIPIDPPRGLIFDRHGVLLASNIPIYVLEIIPERVKDLNKTLARLKILLPSITNEDISNFQHTISRNSRYTPIALKLKLNQDEVAIFASNQYKFPGVSIKARLMRFYPRGEEIAHLLGYVGRLNADELRHVDPRNYQSTNFIGKLGVEKFYEKILHGEVGYQQVETDASGRTLSLLNKQNPVTGAKLYLTIDARLQTAVFEAMKETRGAVVVISTNGGEILAMVSSPTFDPNPFVNGINTADYKKLASSPDRPLYNRAVRGLYPPGSTIKPFIALAGLEKEIIDNNFSIYDPGWFKLPGAKQIYHDWRKHGHGHISLKRAITASCDTYFYHLGRKLGITGIKDFLDQFGFGSLTSIDLSEEARGIIPDPHWKKHTKAVSWYPGDTIITAIGQGFMLVSPLQLANATASLAKKGQRFRPHLLEKIVQSDTGEEIKYQAHEEKPVLLKNYLYWTTVTTAMQDVINSNEGTGYRFGRNPPFSVAAKTGTAQVFGGKQYEKIRYGKMRYEDIPEYLRDHSVFIAFAPVEKPEIAIAVIVENGVTASNVARKVMDAYFDVRNTEHLP